MKMRDHLHVWIKIATFFKHFSIENFSVENFSIFVLWICIYRLMIALMIARTKVTGAGLQVLVFVIC